MPVNAVSNCDNTDFALKTAYYLAHILPVLNQFTQPLVVSRTFFAYLISVSKSNIKKNALKGNKRVWPCPMLTS